MPVPIRRPRRHSPASVGWQRTASARYLATVDVVLAALGGAGLPGDTSHHLKAGIDPASADWPTELLARCTSTAPQCPTWSTRVSRSAPCCLRSPLNSACRRRALVSGMTDGCTAQIAAGAVRPGDTVGVLGTTLVLKAVADSSVADPSGAVYSHYAPDGRWWAGGASNAGAGVLAVEFPDCDLARMDHEAEWHGPARALRYPLAGIGERFPVDRPGPARLPGRRRR